VSSRFIRRTSLVVCGLACLMLAAVILPAVAAAEPPPSLNGEEFNANQLDHPSYSCDPSGTSTMSFSAHGPASGPYPGTFHEDVTTTIGPQNGPGLTGLLGVTFVTGQLETTSESFTIESPTGQVSATTTVDEYVENDVGSCNSIGPSPETDQACLEEFNDPAQLPGLGVESHEMHVLLDYQATISGGAFTDSGWTNSSMVDSHVSCAVGGGGFNGVNEIFFGSNGVQSVGASALALSPPDAVGSVGTSHTVTATATDAAGQPVANTAVSFTVSGSVATNGSCTTAADGTCSFTYAGPDFPGADQINAYADSNENGSQDSGEPAARPATMAWILPSSTPGQVTGGGQVASAGGSDKVAFGFNAKSDSNGLKGNCNLVDPATKTKLDCSNVTAMSVSGTQATIYGDAVVNGQATTYKITVNDLGEPGVGTDTFTIHTASGYQVGGTLKAGNVQVH
jgi:hypothetical protein